MQAGVGFVLIAALAGTLRYDLARTTARKLRPIRRPVMLLPGIQREWPARRPLSAAAEDAHLRAGLNVVEGQVTCEAVAHDLGYAYVDPAGLLQ